MRDVVRDSFLSVYLSISSDLGVERDGTIGEPQHEAEEEGQVGQVHARHAKRGAEVLDA